MYSLSTSVTSSQSAYQLTIGGYKLSELPSSGNLLKVYIGEHMKSKVSYRVVKIPIERFREINHTLNRLITINCKFLVAITDLRVSKHNAYVVEEDVSGISLRQFVAEHKPLDANVAKRILSKVLTGLESLHRAELVHGLLTPDNIVITGTADSLSLKLINYRVVTEEDQKESWRSGMYHAPEERQAGTTSVEGDLYSAGCIAAFLATAQDHYSPRHASCADSSLRRIVNILTHPIPSKRLQASTDILLPENDSQFP